MRNYTGLSLTAVIRFIHSRLGAKLIIPELTDDEIARIVLQESLITYSKYYPYINRIEIEEKNAVATGIYRIPNKDYLEVISLNKMYNHNNMGFLGGSHAMPYMVDPIQQQHISDMRSMFWTPNTWKFMAGGFVEIFPKTHVGVRKILILAETVHPPHLKTIGLNMREDFLDLCFYDVLLALKNLRHRFDSLTTEYGNISLVLDQIDTAEQNRTQLLETFSKDSIFRADGIKLFPF